MKPLKIVSIADIHAGAMDPAFMYNTLKEQFVDKIVTIDFDILAICGDIFDSKFMSNNPIIMYTLQLMDDLVNLCASKNATLIIISGTQSHDNGQLILFYKYLSDPRIDFRIVEDIRFEYIKGLKVLCLPEKYGVPIETYNKVLFESGAYDLVLMHGTIKGSIYGADMEKLDSTHSAVFSLRSFKNCGGLVLAGHVHKPGCFEEYMYYNGCPIRYKFGEEETKGFLVTLYNPYSRMHYTELIPIDSYIYKTIDIDHLINSDPKDIINHIKNIKEEQGIDFIRIKFTDSTDNMEVVKNYFRNNGTVKFQETGKKEKQTQAVDEVVLERMNEYSYILDDNLTGYEKFTRYINQNEGYEFITVDELISILEEAI